MGQGSVLPSLSPQPDGAYAGSGGAQGRSVRRVPLSPPETPPIPDGATRRDGWEFYLQPDLGLFKTTHPSREASGERGVGRGGTRRARLVRRLLRDGVRAAAWLVGCYGPALVQRCLEAWEEARRQGQDLGPGYLVRMVQAAGRQASERTGRQAGKEAGDGDDIAWLRERYERLRPRLHLEVSDGEGGACRRTGAGGDGPCR